MQGKTVTIVFAAASVAAAVVFGGVRAARENASSPPVLEEPVHTAPAEPAKLPPPQPTEQTEPDLLLADRLACAAAAENMEAGHIFVYDCTAGEMLYCTGSPEEKLYPASITKLFTAYVALLYLPPEQVVTVGDELSLVQPGSSTAFLARGHRLTVQMLVEAMLLPSGNDAAYALAAAAGRVIGEDSRLLPAEAVEVFVAEMNRQAEMLGAENTVFANPDGYHQESHVSTPADLALLGAAAAEQPLIGSYSALFADSVKFKSGHTVTWYNTNRLANPGDSFYEPDLAVGKTGYTGQAGYCLLAVVEKEERTVLVGIFGCEDKTRRYTYAHALLDSLGL